MKRFYLVFLLIMVFIIPVFVNADMPSIGYVGIEGGNTYSKDDIFTQDIIVNFSGIGIHNRNSIGVLSVIYDIEYDDSVLDLIEINSDEWDSQIITEDGRRYVVSTLKVGEIDDEKLCDDGFLYCDNYVVHAKFSLKNDSGQSTMFGVNEAYALGYRIEDFPNYDEDNIVALGHGPMGKKIIYINKKVVSEKEEVKETIKENTNNNNNSNSNSNNIAGQNTVKELSSNTKLLNLSIDGYEINFSWDIKTYEIEIEPNVNTLQVEATAEDNKSNIEIKGEDDLKANDYKVIVNVISESGKSDTYTINVKVKEEVKKEDEKRVEEDEKEDKTEEKSSNNKSTFVVLGVSLAIILVLSILITRMIIK